MKFVGDGDYTRQAAQHTPAPTSGEVRRADGSELRRLYLWPCPPCPAGIMNIIAAIITVHNSAATITPEPAAPVATSATAIRIIGMQQIIIISR